MLRYRAGLVFRFEAKQNTFVWAQNRMLARVLKFADSPKFNGY